MQINTNSNDEKSKNKHINTFFVKQLIKNNIRQYTMFIALLTIWIILTVFTKGTFLTARNISNLFLQSATVAIIAIGMTLILIAGHLDLSAGSVVAFIGAVGAVLQVKFGFATIPTIMVCLVIGLIIGIWHGYWVAYKGVPAFIVTLAGMLIFRGAVIGITQGATIGPMNNSFKAIGQSYLPVINESLPFSDTSMILTLSIIIIYIILSLNNRKTKIRYGFDILPKRIEFLKLIVVSTMILGAFISMTIYKGVSYPVLLVMILGIVFHFIANNTVFGKHIYAIGGNKDAARLSGININKVVIILFGIMGLMQALAGIVFTARLNAATAAAGQNFELDAIAACIIGGTSTAGGAGTILGAIIGALVMGSLDNGMSILNLDVTYQYIVKGFILLIAVYVDIKTRQKTT